jgi:hypothetical protein
MSVYIYTNAFGMKCQRQMQYVKVFCTNISRIKLPHKMKAQTMFIVNLIPPVYSFIRMSRTVSEFCWKQTQSTELTRYVFSFTQKQLFHAILVKENCKSKRN